jgi:tetratricopeptide (TPR) repeat protein
MENTKFYMMADRVWEMIEVLPIPFPARADREKEIFSLQGVALDLLLDELEHYLIEYPEERVFYKDAGARLAALEGIRQGQEGFHEQAAHYFELGLALDPENIALRANYALALQSAGRLDEAMRQYRFLIGQPAISGQFLVLIPAAKLFLDCGDPVTAHQILKHCASFMPVDNEFWELYAEARQRSGIARQMMPGQKKLEAKPLPQAVSTADKKGKTTTKKNFCPVCGKPVKPEARFCGGCGRAL